MEELTEFSTIDSAIAVLGALFAGNYFGGEVTHLLLLLFMNFSSGIGSCSTTQGFNSME